METKTNAHVAPVDEHASPDNAVAYHVDAKDEVRVRRRIDFFVMPAMVSHSRESSAASLRHVHGRPHATSSLQAQCISIIPFGWSDGHGSLDVWVASYRWDPPLFLYSSLTCSSNTKVLTDLTGSRVLLRIPRQTNDQLRLRIRAQRLPIALGI